MGRALGRPTWTLAIEYRDRYTLETHVQAGRLLHAMQSLSKEWKQIKDGNGLDWEYAAWALDQLDAALEAAGVTLWSGE